MKICEYCSQPHPDAERVAIATILTTVHATQRQHTKTISAVVCPQCRRTQNPEAGVAPVEAPRSGLGYHPAPHADKE